MKTYTLDQLKKKLTEKERIFCHQYITDWNGARAAREAGYSENTCYVIASENLTKPYIQQYIEFIRNNLEEETGLSKIKVLNELSKIAFSSIAQLYNTWIERKDFEQLTAEQKECIESIDTKIQQRNIGTTREPEIVEIEYVKIKLYSKLQAIESINKMLGYYAPTKSDITSNGKELQVGQVIITKEEVRKISEWLENGC